MNEKARQGRAFASTDMGPFGTVDVREYADASGDSNPIHLDQVVAARAGLVEPVVQGMLVVGNLVRLAEEWCKGADVGSVRSSFVRPVGVNEILHVEGRVVEDGGPGPNPLILRNASNGVEGFNSFKLTPHLAKPAANPAPANGPN